MECQCHQCMLAGYSWVKDKSIHYGIVDKSSSEQQILMHCPFTLAESIVPIMLAVILSKNQMLTG